MTELAKLNMTQLRKSVQLAALPAEEQIASFPKGVAIEDEIAIDFDSYCQWALEGYQAPDLSSEQRSSLLALNTRLDQMSGQKNADLWTDDALRTRAEWEQVRNDARKILAVFGWPMGEGTNQEEGEKKAEKDRHNP
jgi:hypothetical protein